MHPMKSPWFAAVVLAFAFLVTLLPLRNELAQGPLKTFYCAGSVMLSGADPYRVEPLRACEHLVNPDPAFPAARVEPAPLPGYALLPFALLSKLPVKVAQLVFTWLCVAALAVSAWQIAALTRLPSAVVMLGLLPLGYLNIGYGEIPPILLAAITSAGYLLARKQWTWASIAASASMVEPHIGLATCAAVFVLVPRCRWSLALCAVGLSASSFLALGAARNIEYLLGLLPTQAIAELSANDQYSLSHLLHILGIGDHAALLLGSLSYLLMLVIGILLARTLSLRGDSMELIAWLPAAAVLLGGSFVHDIQMIAALPAAFAVAVRTSRFRGIAFCALIALAFVWNLGGGRLLAIISVASALAIALIGYSVVPRSLRLVAAAASALLVFGVAVVFQHITQVGAILAVPTDPVSTTIGPNTLSSIAWGAYLRATPFLSVPRLGVELAKVPTWAALFALVIVAYDLCRRRAKDFAASGQPM